jgi:beta-glucosidase
MPGSAEVDNVTLVYFRPEVLEKEPVNHVNEAADRILSAFYRLNITSQCTPPNCSETFARNASSQAHSILARTLAAESIVLLKNDGDLLPLSTEGLALRNVKSLAVIGPGAVADTFNPTEPGEFKGDWATGDLYSVGGSGHLTPASHVTPLDAIKARAKMAGVRVLASTTSSISRAKRIASQADIAVIIAGTTSGESRDRTTLTLDDGADEMIKAVAGHSSATVVLCVAPGAVTMPWRHEVDAVMLMFLGGQAMGLAWADALFGDQQPGGRLPVTIPETNGDAVQPVDSGADPVATYTEGMYTGYRSGSRMAYPFGHGLGYTAFEYMPPNGYLCGKDAVVCIRQPLTNHGPKEGRTVAQLYLELSSESGHPTPFLKGFQRTAVIQPGDRTEVIFRLTARDLSFYDAWSASWVRAKGSSAHIGESSQDIRQVLPLTHLLRIADSSPLLPVISREASDTTSDTTSVTTSDTTHLLNHLPWDAGSLTFGLMVLPLGICMACCWWRKVRSRGSKEIVYRPPEPMLG